MILRYKYSTIILFYARIYYNINYKLDLDYNGTMIMMLLVYLESWGAFPGALLFDWQRDAVTLAGTGSEVPEFRCQAARKVGGC